MTEDNDNLFFENGYTESGREDLDSKGGLGEEDVYKLIQDQQTDIAEPKVYEDEGD